MDVSRSHHTVVHKLAMQKDDFDDPCWHGRCLRDLTGKRHRKLQVLHLCTYLVGLRLSNRQPAQSDGRMSTRHGNQEQ